MKKVCPFVFPFTCVLFLFAGCTNFMHEMIPSGDSSVSGFELYSGESNASVGCRLVGRDINVEVDPRYDLSDLTPSVKVPENAVVIFLTRECMIKAFPGFAASELTEEYEHARAKGLVGEFGMRIWKVSRDFAVPEIEGGIDFSEDVHFLVVAEDGNASCYTVHASVSQEIGPAS